jgi:hypothetical protein
VFPIPTVTIAQRGPETNHGGRERWVKWFIFRGFDGENIFDFVVTVEERAIRGSLMSLL